MLHEDFPNVILLSVINKLVFTRSTVVQFVFLFVCLCFCFLGGGGWGWVFLSVF